MQSKNALSNLKNRYVAVLKKCALLNVFGTLALATICASPFMASEAFAEVTNQAGDTIDIMNANTEGDTTLTNHGTITGGEASGSTYERHGMYGFGSNNYIFTNNGTIDFDYTASDVVTSGTDPAEASASAFGMYAHGTGNHRLTNNMNSRMTISAKGGRAETNSGDVLAYAYAYGMYGHEHNVRLTNSGEMTVTATGGNASSSSGDIFAYAYTFGMTASGSGSHLTNNNTITVIATGGTTTSTAGSVYANAEAYGMFVNGGSNHILNNFGTITASATVQMVGERTRAFEAYGENNFTVGTWATTLRDWSANDAVFGLANGKAITFGEGSAGATLILRPHSSTVYGQEYSVAKMVSIDDTTGTMVQQTQFVAGSIEGKIAEVKTEVDYLTANLDYSEPANPTVSLTRTVDPVTGNIVADLPTQRLTAQSLSTNLAHLKGVSDVTKNAIANVYNRALGFEDFASNTTGLSAGSSVINPWTIFANAYGSYTDNNEYDYNSSSYGFTGGLTHNFSEQFALGGHFNVNIANSDSDNFDSDSTSFAFGAHAQYFINPNWYVNASASFAFGDSEVEYRQPIGTAKDTFSSFSVFTTLASGYVFEINKNNIIVPEIGLSYLHAENDDYHLDFGAGNEMYNFNLHNTSYDNLYADFSLTWQGNYNLGSSFLSPSVGVGVRQNLTGSDIDASYDLFNNRYETQVSSDDTTFLVDAGLEWTKNNFSISAKYEGELGSEQQSHSGSVNFKYMF